MSFLPSRTQFESCLESFYNEIKLRTSPDQWWTWETIPMLNYAFLKKTSFVISNTESSTPSLDQQDSMLVKEEPDISSSFIVESSRVIQINHHIVYSTSYQVPVLYFSTTYQDGTPLSLDEIQQQIVPEIYHHQVIISQAEHPLLNKPFWYIHPCDTRKLMSAIQFDMEDYIKTWLSFNGPIVKCQISKSLFLSINATK